MISDEAVEVAAMAAAKDEDASNWHDESEYYRNGWRNRMQVGLEAASPFIAAPRTITTVEELLALPSLTVVRSAAGSIVNIVGDEAFFFGYEVTAPVTTLALPATVLHEP